MPYLVDMQDLHDIRAKGKIYQWSAEQGVADIVISEFMDEPVIRETFSAYETLYDPALVDRPDDLFAALAPAKALIVRNRTLVNGVLLNAAPKLRVIGRLGVGLDNIDMDACAARNIAVCPATGANNLSVAEYVITASLLMLRKAWFATGSVADGDWPRMQMIGRELSGKKLGLVGNGAIARQTKILAAPFGLTVAAYDPYLAENDPVWQGVERLSLEGLLAQSDIVSLHVPLTAETRYMIDGPAIAGMKKGALLINAARGGVVEETALIKALRAGKLGGAALDVYEHEPVTRETGARFQSVPNLLLTPHIAGVTEEANARVSQLTAENVLRFL